MNRRQLLQTAALTAAAYPTRNLLAQNPTQVRKVYVVFKCHLDVGFTDTQANVMRKYFDLYYPKAISIAQAQREKGTDLYTWTTGSWLLYEFLEQASAPQRKMMEQAIADHAIAWHALPFSWETEMLTRSMVEGGISFSEELDRRFGKKTTAAKMTDVPGHSRGIVAPLAAHGIKMLDIGVNPASTPPDVPDLFVWQETTGAQVILAYHRMDYGGTIVVPGTDVAYSMQMAGDNAGPHSPEKIADIYGKLRQRFPGAEIVASTLSEVANAIAPFAKTLPVIKEEIGDTWIHGIPSDPPKLAEFRELVRLRERWIAEDRLKLGSAEDRGFLRRFLLGAEHTWGTDTKSYLDYDHYRPKDLKDAEENGLPGYAKMEMSWKEKREDLRAGLPALSATLRAQAITAMQGLIPTQPSTDGMHIAHVGERIETPRWSIAFDARGAIVMLTNKETNRAWASPHNPLALFTYQTMSVKEFSDFIALYIHSTADWAYKDFGKPNIGHFAAQSSEWPARLTGLWTSYDKPARRIVVEMTLAPAPAKASAPVLVANIAPPQTMYLEMRVPDDGPITFTFTTLNKIANRMPEAMWLTFNPIVPSGREGWLLDKVEQPVKPADVVRGGNRTMHAVTTGIGWRGADGTFELHTDDAPVIALGPRTPLCFSRDLPPMDAGFHVNLFNNAWGTNYPQWCGGDWMYRFTLMA
ncbi:MAG: DUF5054 domain-containing protein [Acidobacteria bacterium]|nr:DUF5054 domain-containing protein [Acidobacteriota bacterium]